MTARSATPGRFFLCGVPMQVPEQIKLGYGLRPQRDRHIGEARKYFFFEKKKQKTLLFLVNATDPSAAQLN